MVEHFKIKTPAGKYYLTKIFIGANWLFLKKKSKTAALAIDYGYRFLRRMKDG